MIRKTLRTTSPVSVGIRYAPSKIAWRYHSINIHFKHAIVSLTSAYPEEQVMLTIGRKLVIRTANTL